MKDRSCALPPTPAWTCWFPVCTLEEVLGFNGYEAPYRLGAGEAGCKSCLSSLAGVNLSKWLVLPEPQVPARKMTTVMQAPSSPATIVKPRSLWNGMILLYIWCQNLRWSDLMLRIISVPLSMNIPVFCCRLLITVFSYGPCPGLHWWHYVRYDIYTHSISFLKPQKF